MTKKEVAIGIKNKAIQKIEKSGTAEEIKNSKMQTSMKVLACREPNLTILYYDVPLRKPTKAVNIWAGDKGKIFNVEWDPEGDFHVVNFKRGDWEKRLLTMVVDI